MSELRMVGRPALQRPVLVAAFRGWNDGGQGATLAAGYLARIWNAERFADIDPENFIDFQANRPHVSLDEGLTRRIEWPENAFYHARIPGTERDVVLLLGVEPSLRWQTFSKLVVDLARDLDVELLVTLGSLLADVPHTRAAPVTGAASDPSSSPTSACSIRATRARPGSSASSRTRAGARESLPRACGLPFPTTSRWRRACAPPGLSATGSRSYSTSRSTRRSWPRRRSRTPSRSARPSRRTR